MAQQLSPFIEGKYGWDFGESGWNTGMDENLLKFSFLFDGNVDGVVSSLPTATNGTAYFNTVDNRFYFCIGTTYYSSPVPKWHIFTLKSTGATYQFNGTSLVSIDTPSGIDSRLDSVEGTVESLGTAAFVDASTLATTTALSNAQTTQTNYTNTQVSGLRTDIASTSDNTKGAYQVGRRDRTVGASLDDVVNVKDRGAVGNNTTNDNAAISSAESAVSSQGGGLLLYPSAAGYLGDPAQTVGNVLRQYNGPSSKGNSYTVNDDIARSAKLYRYSDATNHIGKEGYTLFVESRPKGSTDGTVPGSDFGFGVSILKQNWQSTQVQGQNCGINVVTRGGFFGGAVNIANINKANPAVVTTQTNHGFSTGDVVIIQNVLGMVQANKAGTYTITVISPNQFSLNSTDSTGWTTYTSGGIVYPKSGVDFVYNPGDTASYIANTVQSAAGSFSAILEGAAYYMPSGQFIGGSKGIRVQLGAIKHTENIAIGVLAVATNGPCGAAFQAQNSRSDVGIEGSWTKAFSYNFDGGAGAYEAFQINQLGNLILNGGPTATNPTKLIRANSITGSFEIVNNANTAVIFSVNDAGSTNLRSGGIYSINNTQVVGPRDTGWTAFTGTTNKATSYSTSTITLQQLAERVGAIQAALVTHGLLG